MDYESLFNLPTGHADIENVYKTSRGSTYAQHGDQTSTRNRSGDNHKDARTGIQQRSGKTVYMSQNDVNKIAGIYQNAEMGTKLTPIFDENGKSTRQAALQLLEAYGPKPAGTTIATVPFEIQPRVGMNPVELFGSESPVGSSGRNIHFGNAITEVHPKPARLGGKLGIAAALLGGAGSASAGDFRKAMGEIAESFLPLGLTSSSLAPGTLPPGFETMSPEQRNDVINNPDKYKKGGSIAKPISGGNKLI